MLTPNRYCIHTQTVLMCTRMLQRCAHACNPCVQKHGTLTRECICFFLAQAHLTHCIFVQWIGMRNEARAKDHRGNSTAAYPPVSMYGSKKQDTTSQKKVSQLKTNGNGGHALHVTENGRHANLARNQTSFP